MRRRLVQHSTAILAAVIGIVVAAPAAATVSALDPFSGQTVAQYGKGIPNLTVARSEMGTFPQPAPSATCKAGDHPDSIEGDPGLHGGHNCNLSLVGQYTGDGSTGLGLSWYGPCAYMSTMYSTDDPDYNRLKGVVVIDASNPAHPVETARLQTPAMLQPHESLRVNDARGLLAADQGGPIPAPQLPGEPVAFSPGAAFDLYSVRQGCAHPALDTSVEIPNSSGHEGNFSPDGRTYWISTIENPPQPAIIAVDLTDPARPKSILQWQSPVDSKFGFHGLEIQPGGTVGWFMAQDGPANGLVIADTSGVQDRSDQNTPRVIGQVSWHDSDVSQMAQRATIGGHPYAIVTDENGATRQTAQDCAQGTSPFGFLHIVDISAPTQPRAVSTVALQIDNPAHCALMSSLGGGLSELAFSSHYCAVDNPDNTTAVACAWMGSGLRVFDVRDPQHVREIAYYVPHGRPAVVRGDIDHNIIITDPQLDATGTPVRWVHTHSGWELWFASLENGFQIVRLNPSVYPLPHR
jgi:LVIVD repeat